MPDPTTHPILTAISALTDAAIDTDRLVTTIAETHHIDGLAELAGILHDLSQLVKYMCDTVGAEILACDLVEGPDHPWPIPSGGQLVRRGGGKRKNYDQDRLVSAAIARISEQMSDGDEDDTPIAVLTNAGERVPLVSVVGPVALRVAALCGATAASFDGWRVGVAKSLGLNLEDFHEWSTGQPRIAVEGRNPIVRAGEAVLAGDGA